MENTNKYDVFLSYQWDNKAGVLSLREYLIKKYNLRVFIDIEYMTSGNSLSYQLQKSIDAAKLFVCFITKKYSESQNCVNEFNWAVKYRKMRCIVVMLEKVDLGELDNGIGFEISQYLRINMYRDNDPLKNVEGEEFIRLVNDILSLLGVIIHSNNISSLTLTDELNENIHRILNPSDLRENPNTNTTHSKSPYLSNPINQQLPHFPDHLDVNQSRTHTIRTSPIPPSMKTIQQTSTLTSNTLPDTNDCNIPYFKPIVENTETKQSENKKPLTRTDTHKTDAIRYLTGHKRYQLENGDTYDGVFIQGKRDGHGKMNYHTGDIYNGDWQNDQKHGEGTYTYANGDIYSGNWENGQQNGFGILEKKNGDKYESNWKDGTMHGKCLIYYTDGTVFDGNFVDGEKSGFGKQKYFNGAVYLGEWRNGKQNGKGELQLANGDYYNGEFKNGKFEGYGVMTYANGNKYEGNWSNNNKHGKGKLIYASSRSTYDGDFHEDNIKGNGTFSWPDGNRCEGVWQNVSQGNGTFYYNNGSMYTGDLLNFQFHGNGTLIYSDGTRKSGTWSNGNFVQ